jgi:hypothetical protein
MTAMYWSIFIDGNYCYCGHAGAASSVDIGTPLATEMEVQSSGSPLTGCGGESLWLVLQRWKKLARDFYSRRKDEVRKPAMTLPPVHCHVFMLPLFLNVHHSHDIYGYPSRHASPFLCLVYLMFLKHGFTNVCMKLRHMQHRVLGVCCRCILSRRICYFY